MEPLTCLIHEKRMMRANRAVHQQKVIHAAQNSLYGFHISLLVFHGRAPSVPGAWGLKPPTRRALVNICVGCPGLDSSSRFGHHVAGHGFGASLANSLLEWLRA